MSKDRFDEYYLTLTQAKNQEKLGRDAQALTIYLQIIESYSPDTDYAYERAVTLLEKKSDFDQAREICVKALEKINAKDINGNTSFYEQRLNRLDEKMKSLTAKEPSALPEFFRNKSTLAFSLSYLVIAIILSLPNKFSKFAFLIFGAITVVFLFEILRNLKQNAHIRVQSLILVVAMAMTITSAAFVPPPEWAQFLMIQMLSGADGPEVLEPAQDTTKSDEEPEQEPSDISSDDLDTLDKLLDTSYIITSYTINIDGKRIDLEVYLAASVSEDEAKSAISGVLLELNSIKGYDAPTEGRLGALYKFYSVSIKAYDTFGQTFLNGEVNRASQKVAWR